jgi:hypothetical protein
VNRRRITTGASISLGALLVAPAAAQADDFKVTTLADATGLDAPPGSFRKALIDADNNPGADRILFKSKLTGTIHLEGFVAAYSPVEIIGPGPRKLTIDGSSGAGRIFEADAQPGENVSISGLTFTGASTGGAIKSDGPDLALSNMVLSGNTSSANGGGVSSYGGDLTIENSTISGNRAVDSGGGLYAKGATNTVSISNSTISGNSADQAGGILPFDVDLDIRSSTIARNTASDDVGGLFDSYGETTLAGVIIADNAAPSHPEFSNTVNAAFSLIEHVSGPATAENVVETVPGSNLLNVDPKLKPLKDNGGPTKTHALKKKSKAKNKGPSDAPNSDQRGAPRKGKADIGAYELTKCEGVIVNRVGTAGKDKLKGTKKKDGMLGLGGNDKLSGKKGKDGLCGGSGKDKLKGGPGKDKLNGGPGKDKEIQ